MYKKGAFITDPAQYLTSFYHPCMSDIPFANITIHDGNNCLTLESGSISIVKHFTLLLKFIYSQFHDNIYIQVYTCAHGLDKQTVESGSISNVKHFTLLLNFRYIQR